MLNDLFGWIDATSNAFGKAFAAAIDEMQTHGVMEWSGMVWLFIAGGLALACLFVVGAMNFGRPTDE